MIIIPPGTIHRSSLMVKALWATIILILAHFCLSRTHFSSIIPFNLDEISKESSRILWAARNRMLFLMYLYKQLFQAKSFRWVTHKYNGSFITCNYNYKSLINFSIAIVLNMINIVSISKDQFIKRRIFSGPLILIWQAYNTPLTWPWMQFIKILLISQHYTFWYNIPCVFMYTNMIPSSYLRRILIHFLLAIRIDSFSDLTFPASLSACFGSMGRPRYRKEFPKYNCR